MGCKTTTRRHATEAFHCDRPLNGSRLRPMRPCGKDRRTRGRFLIGRFSHPARRCRSSVVEHPLGKGEVVSSILTGSTDKSGTSQNRPRQIAAEQSRIWRAYSHQISTKCSGDVHYLQRPATSLSGFSFDDPAVACEAILPNFSSFKRPNEGDN